MIEALLEFTINYLLFRFGRVVIYIASAGTIKIDKGRPKYGFLVILVGFFSWVLVFSVAYILLFNLILE